MTPILFVFYFTPTEGEHKHRSGSYMSGGSHFSPWGEHLQQHRPRCGGPPRVQQQHQRTGPSQMHGVFQILIIQEDESPWEKRKYLAVCSRFKGTQPCNSNPQIIRFIFKTRHATKWQELWRRIVLIIYSVKSHIIRDTVLVVLQFSRISLISVLFTGECSAILARHQVFYDTSPGQICISCCFVWVLFEHVIFIKSGL